VSHLIFSFGLLFVFFSSRSFFWLFSCCLFNQLFILYLFFLNLLKVWTLLWSWSWNIFGSSLLNNSINKC
jgi:hypothetical protein